MAAALFSRLRRAAQHAAGRKSSKPDTTVLKELCEFEKKWRSQGLSLEDIDYYSLPGHEDEALEALGEELGRQFLREAKYWYHYTFEHNINSACKALETGILTQTPKTQEKKKEQ